MKIYISLIISIFLFACSEQDELDMNVLPDGEYPISFSADNFVMPTSKSFANGGSVGVYMTDNYSVIADSNKEYIYNEGKLTAPANKRYWTRADQIIGVTAYYPRNANISDISDQSTIAQYNSFDILFVTGGVRFNERETKTLTFAHLMSRIELQLDFTGGSYMASDIDQVYIANTIVEGLYPFGSSECVVSNIGEKKHITPYTTDNVIYQAVIIPQTINGTTANPISLIYVTLKQNMRTYCVPVTSSLQFEAGKQYTYTLSIN